MIGWTLPNSIVTCNGCIITIKRCKPTLQVSTWSNMYQNAIRLRRSWTLCLGNILMHFSLSFFPDDYKCSFCKHQGMSWQAPTVCWCKSVFYGDNNYSLRKYCMGALRKVKCRAKPSLGQEIKIIHTPGLGLQSTEGWSCWICSNIKLRKQLPLLLESSQQLCCYILHHSTDHFWWFSLLVSAPMSAFSLITHTLHY